MDETAAARDQFDRRWAEWRSRGHEQDRQTRRPLRVALIVVLVLAAVLAIWVWLG